MGNFLFILMLLLSAYSFAMECTYQANPGKTENVSLLFHGSNAEIAQLRFSVSSPDQYFHLSKVSDDGLKKVYNLFADQHTMKSPLNIVKKPFSMIYVTQVKGGTHYRLKLKRAEYQLSCALKR